MRNKTMRKKIGGMAAALLFVFGTGTLGSAQTEGPGADFRKAADTYAQIFLRMDGDSALVDEAYEAIGTYLESPDPDKLEEAVEAVENSYDRLSGRYEETEAYELPEDIFDSLEACGILYEEFTVFASEEAYQITEYLSDLENLYEYLGYEASDYPMTDDLAFFHEMMCKYQDVNRKYWYTSINYWFAGRPQEELDYLQEVLMDKLVSFYSDGHEWDSSRENVEERMSGYLDEIADMRLEWERHGGERETE